MKNLFKNQSFKLLLPLIGFSQLLLNTSIMAQPPLRNLKLEATGYDFEYALSGQIAGNEFEIVLEPEGGSQKFKGSDYFVFRRANEKCLAPLVVNLSRLGKTNRFRVSYWMPINYTIVGIIRTTNSSSQSNSGSVCQSSDWRRRSKQGKRKWNGSYYENDAGAGGGYDGCNQYSNENSQTTEVERFPQCPDYELGRRTLVKPIQVNGVDYQIEFPWREF